MDMTNIMINCYEEPEMVHTTLDKATQFLIHYVLAYKAAGAHGVMIAEPAAGLLSPAFCGEFSSPYVKRIVDAAQDENFLVLYHNCGNAVDKMVPRSSPPAPQPYHFGNAVDMEEMLRQMPEGILTMGNVDPVGVLRNGTPSRCGRKRWRFWSGAANIPTSCSPPAVTFPPPVPGRTSTPSSPQRRNFTAERRRKERCHGKQ